MTSPSVPRVGARPDGCRTARGNRSGALYGAGQLCGLSLVLGLRA